AIVVTDLESGVILTANRKAEELLGIPVNRIVGMRQEELHPEGEEQRYWQMLEERLRPGGATTSELHLPHADGHLIPRETRGAVGLPWWKRTGPSGPSCSPARRPRRGPPRSASCAATRGIRACHTARRT